MKADNSSLRLVDVVRMQSDKGLGRVHTCFHEQHVLSLLIEGRGVYRSGRLRLPGQAPWLALFPEGDADSNGLRGPYQGWHVLFKWPGTTFQPVRTMEVRIHQGERVQLVPRCVQPDGDFLAEAVRLFERMQAGWRRHDLPGRWQAQAAFLELFARFMETPAAGASGIMHRSLAEFRRLLETRACETVPMDEMARAVRLSPDHLRVLFRRQYGITPQAYRTSVRMNQARTLLRSTTLNVSEVAHRTGYADALYFSRVFHRHVGLPPSRIIRLCQPGQHGVGKA